MTDKIRLTHIARGHLEMVLTWSIEACFSKSCPKEICFPNVGDKEEARRVYKTQAYKLLAKLHNQPLKGKATRDTD